MPDAKPPPIDTHTTTPPEPAPGAEDVGSSLAHVRPDSPASILSVIAGAAANPDIDAEKMERLLAVTERMEANLARAAWADALAKFQAECPVVPKRASAGQGNFAYDYAPYEDIMAAIKPLLSACGLSLSFSSAPTDAGQLHIVIHIAHGTHTESRDFTCPVPTQMKVNQTQQMGAALSYAKRYCLCSALNVTVAGEDFDGGPVRSPAPTADPNAAQAPPRDGEDVRVGIQNGLFARWLAMGRTEADWWPIVQSVAPEKHITGPLALTLDEWGKVGVLVQEAEEAGQ